MLALLQDAAGPSQGEWRAILTIVAGAVAALFSTLTIVYKGRIDDLKAQVETNDKRHERDMANERERTARSEKREADALERLSSLTGIIGAQTTALSEFGTLVKESTVGITKNSDRLEAFSRDLHDIRNAVQDFAYGRDAHSSPSSRSRQGKSHE